MFIKGVPVATICTSLNIAKATFYYHKNKDKAKNISWDDKRYINTKNMINLENDEEDFINTLSYEFKKAITQIKELEDPVEKIEILSKYVSAYYKLKIPAKNDCKAKFVEIATKVIYGLSRLALSQDNEKVVQFLSKNTENIIESIIANRSIK